MTKFWLMREVRKTLPTYARSLLKFGMVGLATAAIYFLVMWAALSGLAINYVLSVTIAYVVSTTFHFLVNRYFTFSAMSGEGIRQVARYLVLWAVNYSITLIIVFLCVERLSWSTYTGVLISVAVTFILGHFIAKNWVFNESR